MVAPSIEFRGQTRLDKAVTVIGRIQGSPSSVTIELPPSAIPNGAVKQGPVDVVLNAAGDFTHLFSSTPYGDYDPAVITATNSDGSTTVTTVPMKLYAPGTAPIGTPHVLLPLVVVPTFNNPNVALNAIVTPIEFVSTSTVDQSNVPFTFAQTFKKGALAPADFLVGKTPDLSDIPLQFNVKATFPDGSVRHAIISGILPALAAGQSRLLNLVRTDISAVTRVAKLSASVNIPVVARAVIDGVPYTASPDGAMQSNACSTWFGGSIATEWTVQVPFKDAQGTVHPYLNASFEVRHYSQANRFRISTSFESTNDFGTIPSVILDASLLIDGVMVYEKPAITHKAGARFRVIRWAGSAPELHIKHDIAYFIGSKAVVNYDQRVKPAEAALNQLAITLASDKFEPMNFGSNPQNTGGTGPQPQIGLLPEWAALCVLSMDKRAKDITLANADIASGSWGIHRRDKSNGPGRGRPISIINYPHASETYWLTNKATGVAERLYGYSGGVDTSHQPHIPYLPYLLTGDFYYLEELHFWVSWNMISQNQTYRSSFMGLCEVSQCRGQAWTMRTLGGATAITPDDHPDKAALRFWMQNNLSNYLAKYPDHPTGLAPSNTLGFISSAGSVIYPGYNVIRHTGIGNFQDDFWTASIGHLAELEIPDALRMLQWKVKWAINRMVGEGACWTHAARYDPSVRDTETGPFYTNMTQVMKASVSPELHALPCGSQERLDQLNKEKGATAPLYVMNDMTGFAWGADDFVSNLQPALAMAADSGTENGIESWMLFDSRAVKPDFSSQPQFAIVPRGVTLEALPEDLPPDPPPNPEPDNPPTISDKSMTIADRVKDSTTTIGTNAFIMSGVPETNFRVFLTSPIKVGDTVPYAARHRTANEWENGFGTLTSANTLARTTVTSSSNADQPVNFSAGVKDVSCDLTAAFADKMASASSAAITAIADPSKVKLLVVDNGVPKQIAITDAGLSFSELTSYASGTSTDEFVINRAGVDGRMSLAAIAAAVAAIIGNTAPPPVVGDTTKPQLSAATGTVTGTTTANVNVTTNEGNGTLYCLVNTSNTATVAQIKAALSMDITASGNKGFSIINLLASTVYYAHFLHRDSAGNESDAVTSAGFTTQAVGTPVPTVTGVTVTPATASVAGNATQQLSAAVSGTNSPSQAVTWAVTSGAGSVNTAGLYTAPAATTVDQVVTVTATSTQDTTQKGTTTITIAAVSQTQYTVTGNGAPPNAIFTTMDGSDANKSNAGATYTLRQFQNAKFAPSQYWLIKSTVGNADPASAMSGWGTSNVTPPAAVTQSENNSAGANSKNGLVPMTHPAAWGNVSYLWLKPGDPTVWYFWIVPANGVPVCVNPAGMTITGLV